MPRSEDAFLQFLRSISGQIVHFFPGAGGLESALSSLALYDLCRENGIDCLSHAEYDEVANGLVMMGAPGATGYAGNERAKRRFAHNRVILLPRSFTAFEEIEAPLISHAMIFCRDRASVRMAELKGADPCRTLLCSDISVHLDLSDLTSGQVRGEGTLALRSDDPRPASTPGDVSTGSHRKDRDSPWLSPDLCRSTVAAAVVLFRPYAEIVTDQPSVAILAAKLGKDVVLHRGPGNVNAAVFEDSILPVYPAVRLEAALEPALSENMPEDGTQAKPGAAEEPEANRPERLLKVAMREAQIARQERDRLFIAAAKLQERFDQKVVAEDRSNHRDPGHRLVTAHYMKQLLSKAEELAEARLADAAREAAERAEKTRHDLESRLAGVERARSEEAARAEETRHDLETRFAGVERARSEEAARAEKTRHDLETRLAAVERARSEEAARAEKARHDLETRLAEVERARGEEAGNQAAAAAKHEADLQGRVADLNGALAARTCQALALQADLDQQKARCRAAEARINVMRALIDRQAMAVEGAY